MEYRLDREVGCNNVTAVAKSIRSNYCGAQCGVSELYAKTEPIWTSATERELFRRIAPSKITNVPMCEIRFVPIVTSCNHSEFLSAHATNSGKHGLVARPTPWPSALPTVPSSSRIISSSQLHSSACGQLFSSGQPWTSWAQTCPSISPSVVSSPQRYAYGLPRSSGDSS